VKKFQETVTAFTEGESRQVQAVVVASSVAVRTDISVRCLSDLCFGVSARVRTAEG
jgi:hypothetical protein